MLFQPCYTVSWGEKDSHTISASLFSHTISTSLFSQGYTGISDNIPTALVSLGEPQGWQSTQLRDTFRRQLSRSPTLSRAAGS